MTNYLDVTELSGEEISGDQLKRLLTRYFWAGKYCKNKIVLEIACGTGPGLGYLKDISKEIYASDFSLPILKKAQEYYNKRVNFSCFDAQKIPFPDNSLDVVIIFEALYYLPSAEMFFKECKRVLKNGGKVLISNANKDLYDFSPSPHSFEYHGVKELVKIMQRFDFSVELFGSASIEKLGLIQKVLRIIKKIAVSMNFMPKTMRGKRFIKRVVFGKQVIMPEELFPKENNIETPTQISSKEANTFYKVILCTGTLSK